jgi:tetratricopeptide (TPR) repeat protein
VLARPSLLLALSLLWLPACALGQPPGDSPDARIHYYRQRLGGRSTYPAYARLGLAYAEKARLTGRTEFNLEAARYLEQSRAMQPNYEALLGLAGVSLALHRFPESLRHAREATETSPSDPAALGALFDAQRGLGNDAEADQALSRMPRESFAYAVRLATVREGRGETASALRDLERACALPETAAGPAMTRAWCEVRMGVLRLASCEPEKARAHYGRALSLVPGYFLAREHLAELEAGEGRTGQAMERYGELLVAVPEPRYRLQLAALHDMAGEAREADAERRQARAELLRRAADDVRDAWHELAELEAEDAATAGEALRWAEKDWRNRKDVHAADALAWASLQHGDARKAEAVIARALASAGASPIILLHAAMIRLRTGHADAARDFHVRALACPAALTPRERRLADHVRSNIP